MSEDIGLYIIVMVGKLTMYHGSRESRRQH